MENNQEKQKDLKPRKHKKPQYIGKNKIVYVIGNPKPEGRMPWQIKLQAISDCARFRKKDNYKEMVERRYQELLRKEK